MNPESGDEAPVPNVRTEVASGGATAKYSGTARETRREGSAWAYRWKDIRGCDELFMHHQCIRGNLETFHSGALWLQYILWFLTLQISIIQKI